MFAPFDGSATWDLLVELIATQPPEIQKRYEALFKELGIARERLSAMTDLFWSWQLTDFSNVDGSSVWTPILALVERMAVKPP